MIYFLGVSPGRYQAIIPTFVVDWDAQALRARVAFGEVAGATATAKAPDAPERRYALRLVKRRLHQAPSAMACSPPTITGARSATCPTIICSMRRTSMADAHELLGQPVLANGIALSKIHHVAFDNHLIGIDSDRWVHTSERLLMLHDGPLLEQSLKAIAGSMIRLPRSSAHRPDRDRLAARFEDFKRAA